ncbi:MAG: DUF951 domain-containing protein [Clostridia bacterium]|nr:DUF951 domain-containing protein [Clostridia bacterium]
MYPFQPGQVATLRKTHPCGGSEWVILRVGADVTARCGKCGRLATMTRREFEKAVRSIREAGENPS